MSTTTKVMILLLVPMHFFLFAGIKYYICRPTHWNRFQLYHWW